MVFSFILACVALSASAGAGEPKDEAISADEANAVLKRFSEYSPAACGLGEIDPARVASNPKECLYGSAWTANARGLKKRNRELRELCSQDSGKKLDGYIGNVSDRVEGVEKTLDEAEKEERFKTTLRLAEKPEFLNALKAFARNAGRAGYEMSLSLTTLELDSCVLKMNQTRPFRPEREQPFFASGECLVLAPTVFCNPTGECALKPQRSCLKLVERAFLSDEEYQRQATLAEDECRAKEQVKFDSCVAEVEKKCADERKALGERHLAEVSDCRRRLVARAEEKRRAEAAGEEKAYQERLAGCERNSGAARVAMLKANREKELAGNTKEIPFEYYSVKRMGLFLQNLYSTAFPGPDRFGACLERLGGAQEVCAVLRDDSEKEQKKFREIYSDARMNELTKLGGEVTKGLSAFIKDNTALSKSAKERLLKRLEKIEFRAPDNIEDLSFASSKAGFQRCLKKNATLKECDSSVIILGPAYMTFLDGTAQGQDLVFGLLSHEIAHTLTLDADSAIDPALKKLSKCLSVRQSFEKYDKDSEIQVGLRRESVADWFSAKAASRFVAARASVEDKRKSFLRVVEGFSCGLGHWELLKARGNSRRPEVSCVMMDFGEVPYPQMKLGGTSGESFVDLKSCKQATFLGSCGSEDCCELYKDECLKEHPIIPDRAALFLADPELKKAGACDVSDKKVKKTTEGACEL